MNIKKNYPLYLAGESLSPPNQDLEIKDKFTGETVSTVPLADKDMIEEAIASAAESARKVAQMRPYERQAVLNHCLRRFEERADELAMALCIEAGKPIKDSRGEVERLIDTFRIASEECQRIEGQTLNLEISERNKGYRGFTKKVPIGPCSFITPFNFPLNLVAHKVAPAIAAGCPFVLKPASRTPVGALIIGEILSETDLPKGSFSILPCGRKAAEKFTTDNRLKFLSFTGSDKVGWDLKARAGKKKVVLELGGNAACIVERGAEIDDAINRIVFGAYYQSGQSCVSVQRILVHKSLYELVCHKLLVAVESLVAGDPKNEDTTIGPMISVEEAERLESWMGEAVAAGGRILCGGKRSGAMFEATLLEGVPEDQKISSKEAFGPVALLSSYDDFDDAIKQVNRSRYGLQAGLFTNDIQLIFRAWDELEVGGVVINDVPSWRADNMPYGGIKDSGLGREGVRYAIEDMMETRLLAIRDLS